MQVTFNNTEKTAGTVEGRNFTISASGKIWVNRSKPSAAVEAAILEAKNAKPAKPAAKKAAAKPVTVKKATAGKEHKLPAKPEAATFGSFVLQQAEAAAKSTAAKPAAKVAVKAIPDEAVITVTGTNPHREGTSRHERFAKVAAANTVGAAREAGVKTKYITRYIKAGLIAVK